MRQPLNLTARGIAILVPKLGAAKLLIFKGIAFGSA
jgi:hypothetical protein